MIQKTIEEIATMLQSECVGCKDIKKKINGVSIDSRTVKEDTLYVPMIGARVDGHSFVDSIDSVTLWQRDHQPYPENVPYILVEDTTVALQRLAKEYMKTLSCKVVAITGSNGKTSTKDMFYSVFSQEKKTQKTQGNRNNELGLPLTILELNEDCEVAILEMGVEHFGDIDFLCQMVRPDISVITTIGTAHMEHMGSKLGIAKAKCEILSNLKPDGLFLYDAQSPEIPEVMKEMEIDPSKEIVSFGDDGDISVTSNIETNRAGISFTCSMFEDKVQLNALGDFQASNALPVIYAALHEGISISSILYGLSHIEMTKMRTQLIPLEKAAILDDTYKSNPESAKAAIDALMSIPCTKHYCVLSDMLDLGPEENDLHESVGKYALEKSVDGVYCVGELSRYTVKGAESLGKWFESKQELIDFIQPLLEEDCVILVKGSRATAMDEIVTALQEE